MAGNLEESGRRELTSREESNHRFRLRLARLIASMSASGDTNFNIFAAVPDYAPPASKEVVQQLPKVAVKKGKSCTICLKKFRVGRKAKQLPCKHFFHSMCISTWLKETNSCPVCRFELLTDDKSYEKFKEARKLATT